jgi:iron complex transport system substrate-binding protein
MDLQRMNARREVVSRGLRVSLCIVLLALGASLPALATQPQRVASLNLCTDQLALVLAEPGQLVSVTWLAHQDYENPYYRAARALPANHGQAEELLRLDADLYLAGPYTARQTVRMLRHFGKQVLELDSADTLEQVRSNIRLVANALGVSARGAATIAALDERLARAAATVAPLARPQRAAVYWPGGTLAGTDTLPGALLAYLGIGNVAQARGPHAWSSLPLEEVIVLRPDWLVVNEYDDQASLRRRAGRHAAYRSMTTRSVTVPSAWWNCGSPALALAAERLVSEIAASSAPP